MVRKASKPRKSFISSLFQHLCAEEGFFCCIKDSVFIEPTCGICVKQICILKKLKGLRNR